MRFAPTSYRPAFGRVLTVVVALVAAAGLAGFVVSGDWLGLARYGWGLVLLAALAFALFWLPRLDIAEHEITVRNVFTTLHVPWPAVQRVDTKYALTLYTTGGKVTAWASPAPNRYSGQVGMSRDASLAAEAGIANPRPGDLLSTQSGAAAYVIRRHFEDLREAGLLDAGVEPGTLRRDVHWVTIGVLAALVAATVLGILL
jgi:hypothetical protein